MPEYPKDMTPELRAALGLMIMQTAPIAHALRPGGEDIPRKAEAEQAHVLHWMIKLTLEHGADWRRLVGVRLEEVVESAKSEQNKHRT